jgi:hypothetical protein
MFETLFKKEDPGQDQKGERLRMRQTFIIHADEYGDAKIAEIYFYATDLTNAVFRCFARRLGIPYGPDVSLSEIFDGIDKKIKEDGRLKPSVLRSAIEGTAVEVKGKQKNIPQGRSQDSLQEIIDNLMFYCGIEGDIDVSVLS